VTIWYWYVVGVIAFVIGFFSYSFLVVAGRADVKRDAVIREEFSKPHSCGSTPGEELSLTENSAKGKGVTPLASIPQAKLP